MKLLAALVALGLVTAPLLATEYYVAPTGDDKNPGTAAKPFLTIQRAASVMKLDDTCHIRQGVYRETVQPWKSGQERRPIRFLAHRGERVGVSGADPVTGWRRHKGNIWKADMPWSVGRNNQVFFDGTMMDEARWPNNTDGKLLTPNGARISTGGDWGLTCRLLPDGLPDDAWKGGVAWVLAGARWTSFTSVVAGYRSAEKKVLFSIPDPAWVREHMNPRRGGEFTLVGCLAGLDAPGEWWYDREGTTLYLIPPVDDDPNKHEVLARRRTAAFDLKGRSYIEIAGIDVHAGGVDMDGADHCLIERMRATYVAHTRGGNTGASLNEKCALYIAGDHNTVRNCEVAFSAGDGIRVGGNHNRVVNCWIHDTGYLGSYGAPIAISGYGHLVSHCTIHDTGRDGILLSGQAHIVQFCDVYNTGLIANDTGLLYTCGNDGGGTEIHHNWFHDNKAAGLGLGIYLDNFTSNYLVHHNVVWACDDPIRLNKPSTYNLIANNTLLGPIANWGRWPDDRMFAVRIHNNLLTKGIQRHPDLVASHNITTTSLDGPAIRSGKDRPGIDAGIVLPGIADQFLGKAPDCGAYEKGDEPPWNAGHDFANPPKAAYKPSQTPLRNHVRNGSFELFRVTTLPVGDELSPWKKTGAKAARPLLGRGGIQTHPDERDSFIGHSACLSGPADDGLEQEIPDLQPNTKYLLAGWLKVKDAAAIRLGVKGHGGKELSKPASKDKWQLVTVEFTTGPGNTSATVCLLKPGPGTAYADDVGLIPALKAEPPAGK
ncbi:MAG TPA: right-handed parallel beta-helix repeat-containing protein [Planctomycetota bacterium]|nr:right-handed parallel beta-helix repeat-containing protein [Planctomycetota bacterium]